MPRTKGASKNDRKRTTRRGSPNSRGPAKQPRAAKRFRPAAPRGGKHALRHTPEALRQMQSLALDEKIALTKERIRAWYEYWDGEVYVCFSGGKDSTVLLHLVRGMHPHVRAAFTDTGLEYPEIRDFVRTVEDVRWLKPAMSFRSVIEKYGYPVVSKRISGYIHDVRHARSDSNTRRLRLTGIRKDGTYSPMSVISKKWVYLCDAPFKISSRCCDVLKMRPTLAFEKESGLKPFLGMMASEGLTRRSTYFKHGCNAFTLTRPRSTPMAFWSDRDVWEYIRRFNIPYSCIYDMGYSRTGCMFCMFGAHLEKPPNRFQQMAYTHPKLHRYCMDKLGLAEVLEFLGVPYEAEETEPE